VELSCGFLARLSTDISLSVYNDRNLYNSHLQTYMELKHIDFTKNELMAKGTKYIIKYSLTVERWKNFEKLQNHFGWGLSFADLAKKHREAMDFANQGKGIEAWNIIYNLWKGVTYRLEDREHPMLLLCTLFIVTETEDLTTWVEEEQVKKIKDWNDEGYDVNDFFQLASNCVKDFLPVYNEIFRSTSQKEEGKKSKPGIRRPSK
jgi:hypothetical protein